MSRTHNGSGGWIRVMDNALPPDSLPIREGAAWSYGPWWVDYNHAPPGAGYLQLLMCLSTKGPFSEVVKEAGNVNVYFMFFPVTPKPMGPLVGDQHALRAGKDYPVWPSSIAQGYVAVDAIRIDWQ